MPRCYACCQENCGYSRCECDCHGTPPKGMPLSVAKAVLSREALRLKEGGGGHGGGSAPARALVEAIERVLIELGDYE